MIADRHWRPNERPAARTGCFEGIRDEYGCCGYQPAQEENRKIAGAQTGGREVGQRSDADSQDADEAQDGGEDVN